MTNPAISVIMPVYNSSLYLREAIDSILNQTFTNFEFLIFNDGSTDDSADIIGSYKDPRLVFIQDSKNTGYVFRLNQGLGLAKGKYIARMDSDDVSHPKRLEKQFEFLETNKEIAFCGTFIKIIGNNTSFFNWVLQSESELLKINLLFDCGVCHPSIMIRNTTIKENKFSYDLSFEPTEDYKLWVKISEKCQIANLPDILFSYRINPNQISWKKNDIQRHNKFELIKHQLKKLHINPSNIELTMHDRIFIPATLPTADYMPKLISWANKLKKANHEFKIYDLLKFDQYIDQLLKKNIIDFEQKIKQLSLKNYLFYLIKKSVKWKSIK